MNIIPQIVVKSFNSKLVRLEAHEYVSYTRCLCRFNSKLVRLEDEDTISDLALAYGFNSKLVRLEVDRITVNERIRKVSIPNWFD